MIVVIGEQNESNLGRGSEVDYNGGKGKKVVGFEYSYKGGVFEVEVCQLFSLTTTVVMDGRPSSCQQSSLNWINGELVIVCLIWLRTKH